MCNLSAISLTTNTNIVHFRWEIAILCKIYCILASFASLLYTYDSVICLISFITLIFTGISLTPFNIFTMVGLLSANRWSLVYGLTEGTQQITDCFASLDRIENFLLIGEVNGNGTYANETGERKYEVNPQKYIIEKKSEESKGEKPFLKATDLTCHWNDDSETAVLTNVNLDINENKLVIVTGPVGCGKSSLLLSLLEEIPPTKGKVLHKGKIAYVPQTSWVFTGTLRENILFNQPFDEEKYRRTIEACDLNTDISTFPNGDKTILGERGCSLSGGQRARVNLARAVYFDADIYLLDDPLSAVDAKVGKHIFEKCIAGVLGNKIRILVTHQLQHLKNADYIVILDKGTIVKEGDYSEIKESGMDLESLEKQLHLDTEKYHKSEGRKMEASTYQEHAKRRESKERDRAQLIACKGLVTSNEDREVGTISSKLYWTYFRAGLHGVLLLLLLLVFLISQGVLWYNYISLYT